jgi:ribosomal protein L40E
MEWLDKIKDTATKTAQIAKEKSGELYEITKLSFTINELETKIDKLFKNTGMLIYRDYENGVELSEDIKMLMQEVDEKFAEIASIKDEINKIKNVSICPNCSKTNPNDANYCLSCGEKLEK